MSPTPSTCPDCGTALREEAHGLSRMLSCPRCAFSAVTTNDRAAPFDPQRYAVFATAAMPPRELAVQLAGVLETPARHLLEVAAGNRPLAQSIDAMEVLRIADLLAGRGITVRTEPPFPWPLPPVDADR